MELLQEIQLHFHKGTFLEDETNVIFKMNTSAKKNNAVFLSFLQNTAQFSKTLVPYFSVETLRNESE